MKGKMQEIHVEAKHGPQGQMRGSKCEELSGTACTTFLSPTLALLRDTMMQLHGDACDAKMTRWDNNG